MRRSNNDGSENGNEIQAKEIIMKEVQNIHVILQKLDKMVAPHVMCYLH